MTNIVHLHDQYTFIADFEYILLAWLAEQDLLSNTVIKVCSHGEYMTSI